MEKTVLTVHGMSCQHCVRAVQKALSALDGVQQASVDLDSKQVTVESNQKIASSVLAAAIEDAGYEVQ